MEKQDKQDKQLLKQTRLQSSDLTQFQAIRSFVSLTDLEQALAEQHYTGKESIAVLIDIIRNSPNEKSRMQAIALLDRKIQQTLDLYLPRSTSALSNTAYAQTVPAAPAARPVGAVPPSYTAAAAPNPMALVDKPPAIDQSDGQLPPSLRGLAYQPI